MRPLLKVLGSILYDINLGEFSFSIFFSPMATINPVVVLFYSESEK